MTIRLYADPITVNCRKAMAGFDLVGCPYELVHVDYFKGEHKAEPFLSLNPNAAVPALRDGEFELWESTRCCSTRPTRWVARAPTRPSCRRAPT